MELAKPKPGWVLAAHTRLERLVVVAHLTQGLGGLRETVSLVLGRFPQFPHAHVDGDVNQSEGEAEREGEG